jgi:uncharacterized membrane protein
VVLSYAKDAPAGARYSFQDFDRTDPLLLLALFVTGVLLLSRWRGIGALRVSTRTSVAMVGTLLSLALIGVLGSVFSRLGRFTGLTDDGSQYISAVATQVDLRGLRLAGLVIGALGVLDDVTVTQVSAVWELADASRASLFTRGMRIGRSHVASR